MRRSPVLAAVVVLTVGAALPAHAKVKPKTYCNLVTDGQNDASVGGTGGATTYDPSLDIVSADVATNAKNLTAVIRVKDLTRDTADNWGKTGRSWSIAFNSGNPNVSLTVYVTPFGTSFGRGTGVVDYDHDLIQYTVKLSDIAYAGIKPGVKLKGFYATSNVVVGLPPDVGGVSFGYGVAPTGAVDEARAPSWAYYPSGGLSCVKVPA